jgi:hypothetical protein
VNASRLASALLLALAVACGPESPAFLCRPNEILSCSCPGGSSGTMVCSADGYSLGSCRCAVDAGDDAPDGGVERPAIDAAEGDGAASDARIADRGPCMMAAWAQCCDDRQNGDETDVDCGGPLCFFNRCSVGQGCRIDSDCSSTVPPRRRCESNRCALQPAGGLCVQGLDCASGVCLIRMNDGGPSDFFCAPGDASAP